MPRLSRSTLLALSVLVALPFQGSRGLYETSEGRYAEVAREMRETGSYLEPTLDYRPHWTKPPLTYWAIAAGLAAFGENGWGVRIYNVVAFSLTVLAVAAIGTALWDPATGGLAGLVYLSSLYPAIGTASATADTLLALFVVSAVLAYVRGWVRGMWLLFGLAFFTKGPPALLPLVALIVFHLGARRPFRLADPVGWLLFLIVGGGWYALEVARHPELARYFLRDEVWARSMSGRFRRNDEWYGALAIYGPMLLIGPGAWIVDAVRLARHERLYAPARIAAALRARGSPGALLVCWFGIPLAVFMLSRSRLPLYLLPIFPAIALAIARGLAPAFASDTGRRRIERIVYASIAAFIASKGVAAYLPSKKDATRIHREAVAAAGPGARFALFGDHELYGFQFHERGDLERWSATGDERWARRGLDAALASRDRERPNAIVVRARRASEFEAALRERALPFRRVSLTGKELFVLD